MWKGKELEFTRRDAIGIEKATLGTVAPGMAGGTGGGGMPVPSTAPVAKTAERVEDGAAAGEGNGVAVPSDLTDEQRAAREAARRRREERRRKPGRGHGRRT